VQQKILARGDISVEDEIADSVFAQVIAILSYFLFECENLKGGCKKMKKKLK
jgi:isocitrate dehydrogenase